MRNTHKIYQAQNLLCNDIREISEIGWFNMQYIKLFDNGSKHLECVIKPAFKIVKLFLLEWKIGVPPIYPRRQRKYYLEDKENTI